jgi:two-component system, cell cycle response regulator CtrA
MRVLLIRSESSIAQSIEPLQMQGFRVCAAELGEDIVARRKCDNYDIILLELLDSVGALGSEFLRDLRMANCKIPVLCLSNQTSIGEKVNCLMLGADDYMTRPFHPEELVARIHAIVRRSKGHSHSIVQVGDLVIDLAGKTIEIGGTRVRLSGKEYQVLELLALEKGRMLDTEALLDHLYDDAGEPDANFLNVFVYKLRRKLANASGGKDYIETVWGRGYALCLENEVSIRA